MATTRYLSRGEIRFFFDGRLNCPHTIEQIAEACGRPFSVDRNARCVQYQRGQSAMASYIKAEFEKFGRFVAAVRRFPEHNPTRQLVHYTPTNDPDLIEADLERREARKNRSLLVMKQRKALGRALISQREQLELPE